jgi:hypothetical protein
MSTFTVTRTNKIASKRRLLVSDRTDLNMSAQRHAARFASRTKLQIALMADYMDTISTIATHHHFLALMLKEVQRYHQRTFNVVLPFRALDILADYAAVEMRKDDEDHYAACLHFMCRHRLYSPEFQEVAALMVAEDALTRVRQESMEMSTVSGGSSSSNGLSDD